MNTRVNINELGSLIKSKRQRENLTLREAAEQCGVSASTLSRIERARNKPDTETMAAIVQWLGVSTDKFLAVENPPLPDEIMHRRGETTPDMIEAHLRADRNLLPETARALANMFRLAYEQFSNLGDKNKIQEVATSE